MKLFVPPSTDSKLIPKHLVIEPRDIRILPSEEKTS